jgi:hypothetical protein
MYIQHPSIGMKVAGIFEMTEDNDISEEKENDIKVDISQEKNMKKKDRRYNQVFQGIYIYTYTYI